MTLRFGVLLACGLLTVAIAQRAQEPRVDESLMADASRLVGTDHLDLPGRPTDVLLLPGAKVAVKDEKGIAFLDLTSRQLLGRVDLEGGTSPIGFATGDGVLWTTDAKGVLVGIDFADPSKPSIAKKIDLAGKYPCGVAILGSKAYVALSISNEAVEVDLAAGKVLRRFKTGVAPFSIAVDPLGSHLFVVEQGGAPPKAHTANAPSAGTAVAVDGRGVALGGSVSEFDLASGTRVANHSLDRQPQSAVWDGDNHRLDIVCVNDDSIVVFDPAKGTTTSTHVGSGLWGAMPTGLAVEDNFLYVTLAGRNEIWKYSLEDPDHPKVEGALPTDWYPVAVSAVGGQLVVANLKGVGSRGVTRPEEQGHNSYDYKGTVSLLSGQKWQAARWRSSSGPPLGLPPIRHVVYVIKENRTFDQIMGDLKKGDADPKLCEFGEKVTPNQHAIATQFVTLDNYYCSGVLSADGHSWATEGNVTPYLERSFGGFERSYTFGDDPITYSGSGFIWDSLIERGLTFRNYGEFDYADTNGPLKGKDLYMASLKGHKVLPLKSNIGVKRVRDLSMIEYPGWDLDISDQYRMDRFEEDFKKSIAKGQMANLTVIYLPQDHTGGPVSPRSHVADNDLAVGRLLDLLSHSPFWKDMAVFVTEDDPQAGVDHVDGHRSTCLVAGPFVRRGEVVSSFFTQASVLRTICGFFGAPPLNLKVAQAPSMAPCFMETPDYSPYSLRPNQIALDEPPPAAALYRSLVAGLDLRTHEVQTPRDMDRLNRAVWFAMRGTEPYPDEWAGAHGRGLKSHGLRAEATGAIDSDGDVD